MGRIAHTTGPAAVRLTALATLIAVLWALVAPPALAGESGETWLVPATDGVPPGAELVGQMPVADALVVRGDAPSDAATLDTELSWQTESDPSYPKDFVDPAVLAVRGFGESGGEGFDDSKAGASALVALIDTGVADVPALEDAVAAEVDFTGQGGGDGFGHGTYMASVMAASSASIARGVAPDAGIVSLKVADSDGTTTLGQVLGAMEWLKGPGRSLGIRVASLSLGVDRDSPAAQLLDMAVDHLAATGVLVVTAAGNDGPGELTSPATAPGALAVGALDGAGGVAHFSADGKDRAGADKPDVFAPGVDVVGHLAPGSAIATVLGEQDVEDDPARDERVDKDLLQGSGTSVATALVSGVAAVVSAEYPQFDGADLAEALLKGGQHPTAASALEAAADITPGRPVAGLDGRAHPGRTPEHANAPGTLPSSGGKANSPQHLGEVPLPPVAAWDPASWDQEKSGWRGSEWAVARWNADDWSVARWNVARWNVARWNVARWNADDWSSATWDASHWDVARWNAEGWSVARWNVTHWHVARWNAEEWSVARWNVARWNADEWNVARWNVARWNASDWSVARWNVARWNAEDWSVARWNTGHWVLMPES